MELSNALTQLDGARQKSILTELIVRQAQESLTLVRERYRVGQASSVEVEPMRSGFRQRAGEPGECPLRLSRRR